MSVLIFVRFKAYFVCFIFPGNAKAQVG